MKSVHRVFYVTIALVALAGCSSSEQVATTESFSEPSDGLVYWYDIDGNIEISNYEISEGLVFVDDDVAIGSANETFADDREIRALLESDDKAVLDRRGRRHWDGGIVPYRIDSNFTPGEAAVIERAIFLWNSQTATTGIEWVRRPRLKGSDDGVYFSRNSRGRNSDRCFSKIGRHQRRKDINLGTNFAGGWTCISVSTITHEMGHALGMQHEARRGHRDSWIQFYDRNYDGTRGDANTRPGLPRRFLAIGPYDDSSIMQYYSSEFSNLAIGGSGGISYYRPTFLSRRTLTLWGNSGSDALLLRATQRWNDRIRLGDHGIDLDGMLVTDVDGDDLDDIVTTFEGGLWWSSQGATGWIPLAPNGNQVDAELDEVAIGDFDGDGTYDVVRITGRDWTLFSGSGDPATVRRNSGIRDAEVGDINNDGSLDVLVVNNDGSWSFGAGPNVLGALVALTDDDMGVEDVSLVRLGGMGANLDVVGFHDGELSYVSSGSREWSTVFASGNGPLPGHADRLSRIWFAHVDGSSATPGEPVDIVTYSNGRDSSGGIRSRFPVYVPDVLGSSARTMSGFRFTGAGTVAIDAEGDVLMGRFLTPNTSAFLTLGIIPEADRQRIAQNALYVNYSNTSCR